MKVEFIYQPFRIYYLKSESKRLFGILEKYSPHILVRNDFRTYQDLCPYTENDLILGSSGLITILEAQPAWLRTSIGFLEVKLQENDWFLVKMAHVRHFGGMDGVVHGHK